MSGLDLESFLLFLRADLGGWALAALGSLTLAILVWVSWGARQAIRRCLALSIAAHVALLVGGGSVPAVMRVLHPHRAEDEATEHIRRIRVSPVVDPSSVTASPDVPPFAAWDGRPGRDAPAPVDRIDEPVALATTRLDALRPEPLPESEQVRLPAPASPPPLAFESATPAAPESPIPAAPEEFPITFGDADSVPILLAEPPETIVATGDGTLNAPDAPTPEPPGIADTAPPRSETPLTADARLRSGRPRPGSGVRPNIAPQVPAPPALALTPPPTVPRPAAPTPSPPVLADLTNRPRGPITEVPRIYRPRLDADRLERAQRSGASLASEQAVERALDWLARHQDADGRWDGGTARYADGEVVEGDDDYTVHCPAGETCFGECAYWEADTGLTGLALLTFLGAGYTHREGKYAATVTRGLNFLLRQQKPDGDLRGVSHTVGMYCHAMATLALCEAYALSLDDRLRSGVERAIDFLGRARASDGLSWRYAPGAAIGDTSILGWVVMALKSAKESGIPIANRESLERGALRWLEQVSDGDAKGLAKYQPWEPVTPTMTAEAWACRQFLGVGGPGPASTEAAEFLLQHESDKGKTNVYYWYYATLAMYQHGGRPWTQWNDRLRNRLIDLQRTSGHQSGSWDPDDSIYGARGGRIYCTTFAAMTLEVYYRYLRLYDEPSLPEEFDDLDVSGSARPAPPLLEAPRTR